MKINAKLLSALGLLAAASAAMADDAPPPTPGSLAAALATSGITATGYVSGTYVYSNGDGFGHQFDAVHDSFQLNQAALTIAYQPKEGFGALVNVIGGTDANLLPPFGSGDVVIPQAFVQYAGGPITIMAGRLLTLAGAEVIAPTGNTNVSRSLLFFAEPLTHTGVRMTVAPSDMVGFTIGVNNGWNYTQLSGASAKTAELGFSLTPSKAFALTAQAYLGKDPFIDGQRELFDIVATINATDALSFVLSYDYGKQSEVVKKAPPLVPADKDASWQGLAAYMNVAFSEMVRLSVRLEYFKDTDGFVFGAADNKVKEGTVTLGISPAKSFEFRIEARYDKSNATIFASGTKDTQTEGLLEALYKF